MSNAKKQAVATVTEQPTQIQIAPQPEAPKQEVLNSDIVIPRLLLMQGLSDFVAKRAKTPSGQPIAQGDLVNSVSLEIVGNPDKTVQIVPLKLTNSWRLEEKIGNKYEYRGTEPRNAKNEDLPWDFKENGADWKRTKCIDVFALLVDDIVSYTAELAKSAASGELPDLNKSLMPVLLSFRVYSYKAGQNIATFFKNLERYPTARAYHYSMALACKQMTNDRGSFYIFETGRTQALPKELVTEAASWYGILNTMKEIRVDASGESEGSSEANLSDNF